MIEENIADTHNRRANIELVSKRAQEYGFPYLVWPEDKFLLRLEDIPEIEGEPNIPPAWRSCEQVSWFYTDSDIPLRRDIRIGYAYSKKTFFGTIARVTEYKVESK